LIANGQTRKLEEPFGTSPIRPKRQGTGNGSFEGDGAWKRWFLTFMAIFRRPNSG